MHHEGSPSCQDCTLILTNSSIATWRKHSLVNMLWDVRFISFLHSICTDTYEGFRIFVLFQRKCRWNRSTWIQTFPLETTDCCGAVTLASMKLVLCTAHPTSTLRDAFEGLSFIPEKWLQSYMQNEEPVRVTSQEKLKETYFRVQNECKGRSKAA